MKKIALMLFGIAMLGMLSVEAQVRRITGTVTSADDGNPIPGVSIMVEGTTLGTITNIDGFYQVDVPDDAGKLVFSFVGMTSQKVEITSGTIDVVLQQELVGLDEVMVVAYGTQTKKSLTGSQSAIKGEELQKIQVSNISRALEGSVAGVQTTSSSGQPGEGAKVRIRGMGSLSASSSPLYVVDGIPYEGNINNISQVDIESMTVLKDASATAIYGARAANGVILITTKRGTSGKPRIVVDSKIGINSKAYEGYDVMTDPAEYYETFWEGLRNDRLYKGNLSFIEAGYYASNRLIKYDNPTTGAAEWMLGYNNYDVPNNQVVDPLTGKVNPNANLLYREDWEDLTFDPGIRQEHSISMSGVSSGTNYFMSFNYLDDQGYSPNSGFERYTTRLKLAQDVTKWLKVHGNMSYVKTNTMNPTSAGSSSANIFYVAQVVAPIYPIYQHNLDGSLRLDKNGNKQYDFGDDKDMKRPMMPLANPAGTQVLNTEETGLDRINFTGGATLSITKDLDLIMNLGIDNAQTNGTRIDNNQIGQYAETGGYISKSSSRTRTINTNQILSFNKKLGEEHSLTAKAGHEYYEWDYSASYGGKQNFLFPEITEMDWAVVMSSVGSYAYDYTLESYFGHVNYGFREKYYLDGSIRYDGSSRFHPDNRWGTFWSVGGSWVMSDEDFLKDLSFLDVLKMRVSYGSIGNDNLGDYTTASGSYYYYAYEDQYNIVNNDGEVGLEFAFKGNKDLKWESNNTFTLGFDFGFLNTFTGNIDYFNRTSSDLLFVLPQAPSSGIPEIPFNIGKLSNKGVELQLNTKLISTKDFSWDVTLNATHYKTTIDELPDMYKEEGLTRGAYQKWDEGSSPYLFYMRRYAGVDSETGQGLWYMDVTDDEGKVTGETTTAVWSDATRYKTDKDATPDLFGGISTTAQFKGFDLSVQTSFQIGGYVYDGVYGGFMHSGDASSVGQNWHRDILKRWTPSNTNTSVPRIDRYVDANNISDRFLTKADYFSLRNIVLGYTLPSYITKEWSIEALRFYVAADNLLFMSRRQGFDPRMYFSGVTTSTDMNYSPIKTISAGLNLTF
ncbi:TonB-linked outer membrane protein, SusC/RagA family [Mariniphaga anaerophila]|uniref:TonB-linked outer membrane protein, SusC/RagA family n=1 Tax=Mariniphaga anaerophila TaxID=1484053 RepID=A0A1M5F6C8_9BACT|nr:TonB-dependent receptor [Mariniphaga anaerophila]SHF87144.1 TonB-linked outer membrane protein, SusC/RagA family [Mariniphaga anaerophila]